MHVQLQEQGVWLAEVVGAGGESKSSCAAGAGSSGNGQGMQAPGFSSG